MKVPARLTQYPQLGVCWLLLSRPQTLERHAAKPRRQFLISSQSFVAARKRRFEDTVTKRRARRRLWGQHPLGWPHVQPPSRARVAQHTRATLADGCGPQHAGRPRPGAVGRVRGRGSQAAGIQQGTAGKQDTRDDRGHACNSGGAGGRGARAHLLLSFACKPFFQFTFQFTR
jgi:hypothetical protein